MKSMVLGIILDLLLVHHSLFFISYPSPEIKFCCSEYNSLVLLLSLSSSFKLHKMMSNWVELDGPAELGPTRPQLVPTIPQTQIIQINNRSSRNSKSSKWQKFGGIRLTLFFLLFGLSCIFFMELFFLDILNSTFSAPAPLPSLIQFLSSVSRILD